MTLNEEVEFVNFSLRMAETMFLQRSDLIEFTVDFKDGQELFVMFDDGNVYVKWRPYYSGERHTIFSFDSSDYVNVMANQCWTFNCYENGGDFGHKYSVLNSLDEKFHDDEAFIDSLCENGRELTEDEYFQACLVHPDMPKTYEDTLLILRTLREGREYKLKNVSVAIYISEHTTMKLLRKIRRSIMTKTGINFLDVPKEK